MSYTESELMDIFIDKIEQCPLCHKVIDPKIIDFFEMDDYYLDPASEIEKNFLVTCYCKSCKRYFHADIAEIYYPYTQTTDYRLVHLYPQEYESCNFTKEIKELSPNFVECYEQSSYAESNNLTLIAGMGYRKALEFLIKDYSISLFPDHEEEICSLSLKKVIDKFIDHPKIKALAIAAAWIGNDETHYVRKHIEYNIDDLKAFIKAMLTYIESEYAFASASELITK